MKKTIAATILLFSLSASARDSLWNLCIGDAVLFMEDHKLVVNVYEHRNGLGRATELTMIFGGHTLTGTFDNTEGDTGSVILKNARSTFKGRVAVDYLENTITLNGVLDVSAKTDVKVKLNCQTLSN